MSKHQEEGFPGKGKRRRSAYVVPVLAAILVLASVLGLVFLQHRQTELEAYRNEMLQLLESRRGEYDEGSIVLADTSESAAKALAEKLNATLRITADGHFAALRLPEGTTILDVYRSDEYLRDLSAMSADWQVKTSELTGEEDAERLTSRPQYDVTDSDYSFQTYLDYLNMQNIWSTTRGSGVTVAVIDTGIDTDHPEFEGRISEYSYNATEDKIVKDYNDWSLIEDEQGHGTAVAGVIGASMGSGAVTGIAPEVTLLVIKAECDENGTFKRTSDLVFGLYYAIERDVAVVNMSFGTYDIVNPFAEATQLAYDSDIICVAAAGNDGTAALCYPAADEHVFGIGALEADGWGLAEYSNYGENSDLVAPGTTYTTLMGGTYGTMNGTSMASPVVAGVLALYVSQNQYQEVSTVRELLYASCCDLGDLGEDWYYGYGALDVSALMLEERGTVTFNMMTDELENTTQVFIRNHTLQNIPEPERLYAVFDGWYYDPQCTDEFDWYTDEFVSDLTLYANWVNEEDGIPYTYVELEDGTIEIRSYTGHRRYLTIPDTIEGKVVSSIGMNAFAGQTRIREINLPKYLVRIRDSAFSGCNNLLNITIPDTVTEIGASAFRDDVRLSYVALGGSSLLERIGSFAFQNCAKLTRFELPATLADMDGSAFYGATSMTAFTVRSGNTAFTAKDGVLFNAAGSTLVCYPAGLSGTYSIPADVRNIGTYAFAFGRLTQVDLAGVESIGASSFAYASLEELVIPDTVSTIGTAAFAGNYRLTSVQIGSGLAAIPGQAFASCSALQRIEIPANIRSIGASAFSGTASMTEVTFAPDSNLTQIGDGAFAGSALVEIEIPASVVTIGSGAFSGDFRLSSVTFGENSSLQTIGEKAFAYDERLTEIILPNQLTAIGGYAFMDAGLETVTIPGSVTALGEGAFASCHSLTEILVEESSANYRDVDGVVYSKDMTTLVEYPAGSPNTSYTMAEGVTILADSAFYGSWNLNTVMLPESLTDIQQYAFFDNRSLQSMSMPDNVMQIGRYAFAQDWALSSVTFAENSKLPRISFGAFAYCGLTSFRVPANVSTMAQGAFAGCGNLTAFTFAANSKLESISAYMFDGCENLKTITFEPGSALTSIQAHGLEGMRNLTSIDFGDAALTNIDNFAFRFCESLTSFTIPEGVTNLGRYAFYYCTNLESVTVPESMEHIGRFAFLGTKNINVYFAAETMPQYLDEDWDHGVTGYYLGVTEVVTDGDWQYARLTDGNIAILKYTGSETEIDLRSLDFGGSIVNIGGSAFAYGTVENIQLPETLVTIQAEAFYHSALKSITIPENVEFIGREAFADTPIQTLTFADNAKLAVLEQSALESTKNLTSVVLPASLRQMGRAVFKNSGIRTLNFAEGFSLTEIPEEAFAYTGITALTLPDSVTLLNHGAFRGTANLETVTFGAGENLMLMSNVFYHSGLKTLEIPANLTYIGEYAFVGLSNLTEFKVAEGNPNYKAVDGLLVSQDGRKLIAAPAGRTGSLTVPEGVEVIGFGAFEDSKLSEILFLDDANILSFGYRAFYNAKNLTEIQIPASVVAIDYYAFANCTALEQVTFAEENLLRGVYEGAFYGCKNLSDITLPDSIVEISEFAFYGCRRLTGLPVSENSELQGIYSYGMAYTGLTELNLPDTVADLDSYAFRGTPLKTVTIPDARAKELVIGIGAFADCNELEEITLPFIGAEFEGEGYTWLGYIFGAGSYKANSIYVPESLKKVTITEGVTSIGAYAFYELASLEEISVPHSVTMLYWDAFGGTTAKYELTNTITTISDKSWDGSIYYYEATSGHFGSGLCGHLELSDSVTNIGNSAFSGCTSLTSIVVSNKNPSYCVVDGILYDKPITSVVFVPAGITGHVTVADGVTSINGSVFSACDGITSITLPDSMTSIGERAFAWCSSLTSITIPDSVTSIGEMAFAGCSSLTSITIPDGVTGIESGAFCDCSGLTSITIPNSVTSIGDWAFSGCSNLYVVYNNSDLEFTIGSTDYGNIAEYAKLIVDKNGNKTYLDAASGFAYVDTADGFRFVKENGAYTLIAYLGTEDTVTLPAKINGKSYSIYRMHGVRNVILPDGMTSLGDYAFQDCRSLESIVIPSSVTSIDFCAFDGCWNLTSITIPNSVTSIGSWAFSDCYSLKSITIPNSVTSIGVRAFARCHRLTSIAIPDSVTSIGNDAFRNCRSLESITIGKKLAYLGTGVFAGCPITNFQISDGNANFTFRDGVLYDKNVTSILYVMDNVETVCVPATVTNIGSSFQEKTKIKSITFAPGSKLKSIDYDAFYWCLSLESIIIPDGVTSIGDNAFSQCISLTSITIPNSVTSIGIFAFDGCGNLTSITIPNSVTSIGDYAFNWCDGLTSIMIGNGVTSIGSSAFYGCESLTSITFPDSVTSIGSGAFSWCTGLTSVTIPDSVTSIGDYAFYGCTGLTSIVVSDKNPSYCVVDGILYDKPITSVVCVPAGITGHITVADGVTSINGSVFSSCDGITSITLPDSVTSIGERAFAWCSGLTSITIPDSVTSIGDQAFYDCSNLYVVYNNSDLEFTIGSTDYGNIAEYAKLIVDKNGNKTYLDEASGFAYVDTADGFRFVKVNGAYMLIAYLGKEDTVTLPTDIDGNSYTIYRMHGVRNVILPDGMTSIGDWAFYNCRSLTSVTIPDSVTKIGDYAFSSCTGLTSITIPNSVTSIGDYAFNWCDGLTSIMIGNGVSSIGSYVFTETAYYNNPDNWEDGTMYIGNHLIRAAEDATIFAVREGTKSIAYDAFEGCYQLKKLTIGGNHSGVLSTLTNLETLVITEMPNRIVDYFGWFVDQFPITLKNIVLADGVRMNAAAFYDYYGTPITGMTIYVAANEKDVRWDENFPGWSGGNRVVYGDKWITANFYDADGNCIASELFGTSQVIRQPYVASVLDGIYCNHFQGWDMDGDGIADVLPATSTKDIEAYAVFGREYKCAMVGHTYDYACDETCNICGHTRTVTHDYHTEWSGDGTHHWHECGICGHHADEAEHEFDESKTCIICGRNAVPSTISSPIYTISDGFISKIAAGTKVSALLDGTNEGEYCRVYQGDQEVSGDSLVGTGMAVRIMDGDTVVASYTVIVTGDTNGDGSITITDMIAIKAHVLKKATLSGAFATAADTNGDGTISITDFIQVKAKVLGKGEITAR